jgi:hypothetical protein
MKLITIFAAYIPYSENGRELHEKLKNLSPVAAIVILVFFATLLAWLFKRRSP